ncbi:MAG: adenine phosphoribosyltransferase [Thermaerobacter sp.]|nr:adenine phosphoribosyltransferase [Thermaerobacter sp.]
MAWLEYVREIPDFPRPGVLFRDVLPVLADREVWREVVTLMADAAAPWQPDVIAAPEARGFVLAGALADRLQTGVVLARKAGKLPPPVVSAEYTLEYGDNRLEIEAWDRLANRRVVLVDDVLATGGTVRAATRLIAELGGIVVGYVFLIELAALGGRARLGPGAEIRSLATR